jgi:site-specific DNA recombinase
MTLRAGCYLRVSSLQQRDRVTIDSQRRDAPAYCRSQGWTIAGIYEDDGRSAKAGQLEKRAAFARLLADCRAGKIDVVVVVAVDRLTRSEDPVERVQVVASITATGAKIAIVGAGIQDPRTFAGDAYLTLQALFASEENRRRRERVIAGGITSAQRGRNPRGVVPYGLTFDPKSGAWGIDTAKAKAVRELVRRVIAGEPMRTVGRDFEQRGIQRPRGGAWSTDRIQALIRSDVYAGRFVVDRARKLSVAVPSIIDADDLAEARAVIAGRRRPPVRVIHHHLLTGIATCGLCHEPIGMAGSPIAGRPYHYYRCLARRGDTPRRDRCDLPNTRVDPVDDLVWSQVADAIARPETIDRMLARRDNPEPADALEKARARIADLDRLTDSLLDQAARGLIAPEVATAQIERLGKQRQLAQAALRTAEAGAVGIRAVARRDDVTEQLRLLRLGAEHAARERRPAILRALVGAVVIGPGSIAIDLAIDVPTSLPGTRSGSADRLPVMKLEAGRIHIPTPTVRRTYPHRRTA